jgi:hypothetical protein
MKMKIEKYEDILLYTHYINNICNVDFLKNNTFIFFSTINDNNDMKSLFKMKYNTYYVGVYRDNLKNGSVLIDLYDDYFLYINRDIKFFKLEKSPNSYKSNTISEFLTIGSKNIEIYPNFDKLKNYIDINFLHKDDTNTIYNLTLSKLKSILDYNNTIKTSNTPSVKIFVPIDYEILNTLASNGYIQRLFKSLDIKKIQHLIILYHSINIVLKNRINTENILFVNYCSGLNNIHIQNLIDDPEKELLDYKIIYQNIDNNEYIEYQPELLKFIKSYVIGNNDEEFDNFIKNGLTYDFCDDFLKRYKNILV